MTRTKRSFGAIRRLPSKRYQASYIGLDMVRYNAEHTFSSRMDAEGWLSSEKRLLELDLWEPPPQRRAKRRLISLTFGDYAEEWLPQRTAARGLKPKTVSEYRRYLDRLILPHLGSVRLKDIEPVMIRSWLRTLNPGTPRLNHHAYVLVKGILATAVEDQLLAANPCREKVRRPARTIGEPATLQELAMLVAALPERLQLMVELAAWCALRFGEVAELRRGDVDLEQGVITITRAVQWVDGEKLVAAPKAGSARVVAFPPHLAAKIERQVVQFAQPGRNGLLFATVNGGQYRPPTFHQAYFRRAREAAGRPDLRFHDLRHTGATLAAMSGATLAELMARLGHSSVQAALAYQHAAQGSDKRIAAELSRIATNASLDPPQAL